MFDAITVANEELRAARLLLETHNLPPFEVRHIWGAGQPEVLMEAIQVTGWKPIRAEVRVTKVDHLIRMFSGAAFYGANLAVPLRELIQNAADAIRARRAWDPNPSFRGQIVVRLQALAESDEFLVIVEDDGIGMSQGVLTGPLLDFGNSYWNSDLARSEFPGLTAKRRRQTGRYGIGFFSVLMVAKRVDVCSRPYHSGLDQIMTLSLQDTRELRPILLSGPSESFDSTMSTCVILHMTGETLRRMLKVQVTRFDDPVDVSIEHLVSRMCPTLDCDVCVEKAQGVRTVVHRADWPDESASEWLRRTFLANVINDDEFSRYLEQAARFVRLIASDGIIYGRAAIGFRYFNTALHVVGHFTIGIQIRDTLQAGEYLVGVVEDESSGPDRQNSAGRAAPAAVAAWATDQAQLLGQSDLDAGPRYVAAINVAYCGGDPSPIAHVSINRKLMPLPEIFELLKKTTHILAVVHNDRNEGIRLGWLLVGSVYAKYAVRPTEIEFDGQVMEIVELGGRLSLVYNPYASIPNATATAPSSFLNCLMRYASDRGWEVSIEFDDDQLFGRYVGKSSDREGIVTGTPLRGPGLRIHAKQRQ